MRSLVLGLIFLGLFIGIVATGAWLSQQPQVVRQDPADCPIQIVLSPQGEGRWNVTYVNGTWTLDALTYELVGEGPRPANATLAQPAEGARWIDARGPGTVDLGDVLEANVTGTWNVWLRDASGAGVGGTFLCL